MSAEQVAGCETLVAATSGLPVAHRAYLLATAFHETARTMLPITEYGPRSYFMKYEPGTKIGKTLGNVLPGDGYLFRGRGYVQITGRSNYLKATEEIGVDLIGNPDAALNPTVAARILVRGCSEGWFTGKKLADYASYVNMRRVVNGTDDATEIAGYAEQFEAALRTVEAPALAPTPVDDSPAADPAVEVPAQGGWAAIIAAILRLLSGGAK
jgi:hypothetical protein